MLLKPKGSKEKTLLQQHVLTVTPTACIGLTEDIYLYCMPIIINIFLEKREYEKRTADDNVEQ